VQPDASGFGGLALSDSGRELMRGALTFSMRLDAAMPAGRRRSRAAAAQDESHVNQALLDALKATRRELADGQPLYTVFSNRTLIEMAAFAPRTLSEMRAVHGVGDAKLQRYGHAFLDVLRRWRENG